MVAKDIARRGTLVAFIATRHYVIYLFSERPSIYVATTSTFVGALEPWSCTHITSLDWVLCLINSIIKCALVKAGNI